MTNGSVCAHRRDVVIVGGGVMGTSTAYQLARAGVTDVTVLESGELGGGSSAKPLGGVRALFSDAANIALGSRSLEAFRRFDTEVGMDIGLQQSATCLPSATPTTSPILRTEWPCRTRWEFPAGRSAAPRRSITVATRPVRTWSPLSGPPGPTAGS